MTNSERFDASLTSVREGATIKTVIAKYYRNRRQYTQHTTAQQRATLSRCRAEYLETKKDPERNSYPRLYLETTAERQQAVKDYCKKKKIPIGRFVNSAIAKALEESKGEES